jgi:hypothetical protein
VKSQHTQRHTHAPRATKELVAPRRQRHIAPGCRTLDLPHSQSTASCTGPGHFPPLASVKGQGGSPRAAPPSCSDSCVCLWWLLGKIVLKHQFLPSKSRLAALQIQRPRVINLLPIRVLHLCSQTSSPHPHCHTRVAWSLCQLEGEEGRRASPGLLEGSDSPVTSRGLRYTTGLAWLL